MRKKLLRGEAMTDATYVDQAADWAKALTRREARGPGDLENAWRRLEARYGLPWRLFWQLRYRKPCSITAFLFARLQAAYQAECDRQLKLIQHEIEVTKAIAGPDNAAVVAAETVVGEAAKK